MLNILFADDDILLLNKMATIIDWEKHGFNIVGTVMDGKTCLDVLEKQEVDILFLDIHMPVIDGLEVCSHIHKSNKNTEVIILSNYDDFDFVRGTMRMGAFDYMLKHQIQAETVISKLEELKNKIETIKADKSRLSVYTTMAKQKFIKDLILSGNEQKEKYGQFKEFSANAYILCILQIVNFELHLHFNPTLNKEKLEQSIVSIGASLSETAGIGLTVPLDYGQFAILFSFENEVSVKGMQEKAILFARLMASNIQKFFGLSTEWAQSDVFHSISSISDIYVKVQETMNHTARHSDESLDLQYSKELITALSLLDYKKLELLLENIYHEYGNSSGELSQQIIRELLNTGERYQIDNKMPLIKDTDSNFFAQVIKPLKTKDVGEFLRDYFRRIIYSGTESDIYSVYVKKVLFAINSRYAEELSLTTLAEEFNISSSYLSRIFKKETGDSFIDRLISHRIKIARELMQNTDLSLAQIADKCGFRNYNYFLRCYKQRMGTTAASDMLKNKSKRV